MLALRRLNARSPSSAEVTACVAWRARFALDFGLFVVVVGGGGVVVVFVFVFLFLLCVFCLGFACVLLCVCLCVCVFVLLALLCCGWVGGLRFFSLVRSVAAGGVPRLRVSFVCVCVCVCVCVLPFVLFRPLTTSVCSSRSLLVRV